MVENNTSNRSEPAQRRTFLLLISTFISVQIIILCLAFGALWLTNMTRAYTAGEGLYSKSQKQAVTALQRYAFTQDAADYQAFQLSMRRQAAIAEARGALQRQPPDTSAARAAFAGGGIHPDDIAGMVRMFVWFGDTSVFEPAMAIWARGERLIALLDSRAEALHRVIVAGRLDPARRAAFLADILEIDRQATELQDAFSRTLGESARSVGTGVLVVLVLASVLLWTASLWFAGRLNQRGVAAEAALGLREQRLRSLMNSTADGIISIGPDARIETANRAARRLFGFQGGDLKQRPVTTLVAPKDREGCAARVQALLRGESQEYATRIFTFDGQRADKTVFPMEIAFSRQQGADETRVIASLRDITERRAIEAAWQRGRRLSERRGEILEWVARDRPLISILDGVAATVEEYHEHVTVFIVQLEHGVAELVSAPRLSAACAASIHRRLPSAIGGAIEAALLDSHKLQLESEHSADDDARGLTRAMRASGHGELIVVPVTDHDQTVLGLLGAFLATPDAVDNELRGALREMAQIVAIAQEQHRLHEQLLRQAQYDLLTELPNRALLGDRMQEFIVEARRGDGAVGLFLLDLDDFKLVNDTLGHQAGDLLLREVAARLQKCLRDTDIAARFGGDEFVVAAPLRQAADAADVAERIITALAPKFRIEGKEITARPSIGISLFPQDGETVGNLVQAADTAMYAAKKAGQGPYHYFQKSMNQEISETVRIEAELRQALEDESLLLYFQPRVNLADGSIRGAEALLRWQHPIRGLLLPGEFLGVAERSALISEIDRYVLTRAARQSAAWRAAGHEIPISINLSALEFHRDGFGATVARLLAENDADPGLIELEITESMLMQDFARVIQQLRDLRARAPGIRIAVDDFGTGYSSLSYLQNLPVDTLKIDRSFIAALGEDSAGTGRTIAQVVVDLGHTLGLHVVAEGVETREQQDLLVALGCDEAQGYWFDRPLPVAEFEVWLGQPEDQLSARRRQRDQTRLARAPQG